MAMISRLKMTLAVCLALTPVMAPSMSLAQDAAAPAAATPAAPLTKETAQLGQIYVASASDPWETRCTKTDGAKDPCQLFQLLRDEKGGAVAEVNLFGVLPGGKAAAGAAVVAPLETLLPTGVVIQIDDKDPKVYPFAFCNSYGCVSRIGFTPEELDQLKAGKAATVTIVPAAAPDNKVVLKLSLAGFTAGFEAVAATLTP